MALRCSIPVQQLSSRNCSAGMAYREWQLRTSVILDVLLRSWRIGFALVMLQTYSISNRRPAVILPSNSRLLRQLSKAADKDLAEARETAEQLHRAAGSTRVFLVGKNFSVLDTEVIAGGVDVTDSVRLLSRNLMSVRIPSDVSTIQLARRKASGQRHVVVNLMTPYGAASNRSADSCPGTRVQDCREDRQLMPPRPQRRPQVKKHVSDAHPVSYKIDDAPKDEVRLPRRWIYEERPR